MKSSKFKFSFYLLVSIFLTLGLSISSRSLLAQWTPPSSNPPDQGTILLFYNSGTAVNPILNSTLTVNDNFYVGTDSFFVNKDSGQVGIGTTNPSYRLDVNGTFHANNTVILSNLAGTNNRMVIALPSGQLSTQAIPTGSTLPIGSSGQTLRHNGTSWVGSGIIYNNATNIGIGTTNPSYRLDVNGTFRANSTVLLSNLAGTNNRMVIALPSGQLSTQAIPTGSTLPIGSSGQTLRHNGTSWASNSNIYDNGSNVGIGVTLPSQKLDVNGKIRMRSVTASTDAADTVATKGYVDSNSGSIPCNWSEWLRTSANITCGTGCSCSATALTLELRCLGGKVTEARSVSICHACICGLTP